MGENDVTVNSGNEQVANTNSTTGAAEGFLNAAAAQAKGEAPIAQQMYDNVIHEAGDWTLGQKEQFLGQLSAQYVDTMYTDASWTDKYADLFFEDSEQFGSIVQIINTEMPEVRENRAWQDVTQGRIQIGTNMAYLPVVKEQLTGGTASWAVSYTLTGTMLDAAFKNSAGLRRFESNVILQAENSGRYHIARMSAANRNNYIAEKLAKGNAAGNINVVNVVAEYCKMFGKQSMTAAAFRANTDGCLRSMNWIFKRYKAFLTDLTTLFTMDATSTGKFIPADRFTFTLLSDVSSLLESELYSTTFHDNFVTLKGYREIPSWQALRGADVGSELTFDVLSTLNIGRENSVINTSGIEVEKSGVIGLMVDKWAIMHTIVKHRTGIQRDDIKDITLIEHQYTDRYVNNLMLPGVVFTLEDYTAA